MPSPLGIPLGSFCHSYGSANSLDRAEAYLRLNQADSQVTRARAYNRHNAPSSLVLQGSQRARRKTSWSHLSFVEPIGYLDSIRFPIEARCQWIVQV